MPKIPFVSLSGLVITLYQCAPKVRVDRLSGYRPVYVSILVVGHGGGWANSVLERKSRGKENKYTQLQLAYR